MAEGYKAQVVECGKKLSAKEKIMLKNFTESHQLDELTQEGDGVLINIDYVAKVSVHNEKSDNKDYMKYVYVDKDGTKYISGSETLYQQYMDIAEEIESEEGEDFEYSIKVIRKPSKNYKGKDFLTCVIV